MSEFAKIPSGWSSVQLGDALLAVVGGGTPSRNMLSYFRGVIPWFTVKDMKVLKPRDAEEHISEIAIADSATNLIPANTVIVATRIALGRAIRPTVNCAINQDLKALITGAGIEPDFVLYWIGANERVIQDLGSGTTVSGIRLETLNTLPLLLPPSAEQTRIIEKLEELFSDLDAGVAELKAAQKKLAQYRQSLLKAAVEGALTAEWRKHNPPQETGAQLLARILKERRVRWEAKKRAKFAEQGKAAPKDWQDKYPEPVKPDTSELPKLPEGWVWASLGQILCELRSGTAETSGREVTEFPILKSSAVRQGKINFHALNYLREGQSNVQENYLELDDILITRLSGSIEYVGCCAIVRNLPSIGIQYPDRIFRGTLAPSLMWLGDFLALCFQSSYVRKRLEAAAKSTAGHKRISLSDLHPLPIPVPPSIEIKEILNQVEKILDRIDNGEPAVLIGLNQAAAQRKNILKAAFSGQLVPQDPNDEPASVLLERIRAERAERDKQPKPRKPRAVKEAA